MQELHQVQNLRVRVVKPVHHIIRTSRPPGDGFQERTNWDGSTVPSSTIRLADPNHHTTPQVLKTDRMGPLVEYAGMYRQLGRTDLFKSDYCNTKAAAAHKRWFAAASSAASADRLAGAGAGDGSELGGTGSGLATWLPSFLEYLQVRLGVVWYCCRRRSCCLLVVAGGGLWVVR